MQLLLKIHIMLSIMTSISTVCPVSGMNGNSPFVVLFKSEKEAAIFNYETMKIEEVTLNDNIEDSQIDKWQDRKPPLLNEWKKKNENFSLKTLWTYKNKYFEYLDKLYQIVKNGNKTALYNQTFTYSKEFWTQTFQLWKLVETKETNLFKNRFLHKYVFVQKDENAHIVVEVNNKVKLENGDSYNIEEIRLVPQEHDVVTYNNKQYFVSSVDNKLEASITDYNDKLEVPLYQLTIFEDETTQFEKLKESSTPPADTSVQLGKDLKNEGREGSKLLKEIWSKTKYQNQLLRGELRNVPGDGACFFHALNVAFARQEGSDESTNKDKVLDLKKNKLKLSQLVYSSYPVIQSTYEEGIITAVNEDNTYNIRFNDKIERNVKSDRIKGTPKKGGSVKVKFVRTEWKSRREDRYNNGYYGGDKESPEIKSKLLDGEENGLKRDLILCMWQLQFVIIKHANDDELVFADDANKNKLKELLINPNAMHLVHNAAHFRVFLPDLFEYPTKLMLTLYVFQYAYYA